MATLEQDDERGAAMPYGDCIARGRERLQHLLTITDRTELMRRMQVIDPNGCWTDELSEAEGLEPTEPIHAHRVIREWMADLDGCLN